MNTRLIRIVEIVLIVAFAFVPVFINFPYRVNIFLSWEGAYRISQGQIPFRDFGTPVGGMYWVVPALFFKWLGPQMITLVKAQVLLNIIAGLSFRSVLNSLKTDPYIEFVSVVVFLLSYSLFNFWPWYNHTVIVYQLASLAFLFKFLCSLQNTKSGYLWLLGAAFFSTASFFTKQDGGALGIIISFVLLLYYCFINKRILSLVLFGGLMIIFFLGTILLFGPSMAYWFNIGQPPHSSRISIADIFEDFFSGSQWIKFYLFLILLLSIPDMLDWRRFLVEKNKMIFLLLTLGILTEAAILQVTSYTPPDNNIFFHSFAIAFILHKIIQNGSSSKYKNSFLAFSFIGILIWWSPTYWKYAQRIFPKKSKEKNRVSTENIVNRKTYVINYSVDSIPMREWKFSKLKSLEKISMPVYTIQGIERLLADSVFHRNKDPKVLNMTELTSLAVEIPYKLEKGNHYPLWFHLGVGMFNKQAEMFEDRLKSQHYDIVLFENIPSLNNFYPFRVRDSLKVHYSLTDSFPAPRRGDTQGYIEVYHKRKLH